MRPSIDIAMPKEPQTRFLRRFAFGLLGTILMTLLLSRTHFFHGWVEAVAMCVSVSFGWAMSAIIWPKVSLMKAQQPVEPDS